MIIREIGNYVEEKIIFDDYIPIQVEFNHSIDLGKDRILYWRIGDFKKSLMEISISENSCKLLSLTLTLFNKINKDIKRKNSGDEILKKEGLPIIDIKKWPKNRYLDVNKEFKVDVGHESIIIKIENKNIKFEIVNGKVSFGIGEDNDLCKIEIDNIEKNKINYFKERWLS